LNSKKKGETRDRVDDYHFNYAIKYLCNQRTENIQVLITLSHYHDFVWATTDASRFSRATGVDWIST